MRWPFSDLKLFWFCNEYKYLLSKRNSDHICFDTYIIHNLNAKVDVFKQVELSISNFETFVNQLYVENNMN